MPVSAAVGHDITTIEAIGATPAGRGSNRPGSISRSSSAATASPARSWRRCVAREATGAHGYRYRPGDVRQHLPLRHLSRIREAIKRAAQTTSTAKREPDHGPRFTSAILTSGLATGGGLLLGGMSTRGRASSQQPRRRRRRLRAERVHSHRHRRPDHAHHVPGRNGSGHVHVDAHAAGGRARGRTGPGPARARSSRRQALRQSALPDDQVTLDVR